MENSDHPLSAFSETDLLIELKRRKSASVSSVEPQGPLLAKASWPEISDEIRARSYAFVLVAEPHFHPAAKGAPNDKARDVFSSSGPTITSALGMVAFFQIRLNRFLTDIFRKIEPLDGQGP